jgi:rhodanese-related sulfurtransferase
VSLRPPPSPGQRDRGGAALGAIAILLVSVALGLIVNHLSARGLPVLQQVEAGHVPLPKGLREFTLEQTKAALVSPSAVLLDARSPEEYAAGHVPGALSVPPDQIGEALPRAEERVLAARTVIVYCASDDCGDAIAVTEYVRQIAPDRVFIFVGGWRAWTAARYPVTTGEQP